MQETPPVLEPGTLLAGRLRIVRLLGSGGMGAVYEIEHELTKHRRAVKLLHANMAAVPGVVARFLREASAAGRIGNPHIIETFDAGELPTGEPYIVMELLKGSSLERVLHQKGRLSSPEAVEIIRQTCNGVQAAHDSGIVHRDLKPENLFLLEGERLFVKILDFGISKFDPGKTGDFNVTREGTALGTPFYMAPEQVRGETSLGPSADVYALGVVLYECLTGVRPFDAETLPHLAVLIHEGKYTPLRELRPDLPGELEAVVARAMAVSPAQRFPSARAFREALDRIVPVRFDAPPVAISSNVSGLEATMAAPAVVGAASVPTAPGVTLASHPTRGRALWLALVVVALSLIGVVIAIRGRLGANAVAPVPSAESAAAVVPKRTDAAVRSVPAEPVVEPVASASASAADASTRASAPGARPAMLPGKAAPLGSAKKDGHSPATRAGQHGLIQENPF